MTTSPLRRLSVLLPERRRFAGQPITPQVAKALGRADCSNDGEAGEVAQLRRYFTLPSEHWPMAALTRQLDCSDAANHAWLCADPAHVRPDINGVRLMACGHVGLSAEEADGLVRSLQPLFEDVGVLLMSAPQRWHLRLHPTVQLPECSSPEQALGEDLLAHLPRGPAGARWRGLLNEAQIVLHQHAINHDRSAAGKPEVNSLWFWGGGSLPDAVTGQAGVIESNEADLCALAKASTGEHVDALHHLIDLRDQRNWAQLEQERLLPALQALASGSLELLVLDFSDGVRYHLSAGQRWRVWRPAMAAW